MHAEIRMMHGVWLYACGPVMPSMVKEPMPFTFDYTHDLHCHSCNNQTDKSYK